MARIADEWLSVLARLSPGLEALLVCLLAVAALLLPPQPVIDVTSPARVIAMDGPDGLERWLADREPGQPIAYRALTRPDTTGWLIWDEAPLSRDGAPPAVLLSGPFSARVLVNGREIGAKGQPGASGDTEVAGPIESVLAIPTALIRDRDNWIAVQLSSHHAGYRPHSVVQGFFLVPYNPDARRPIRYYLPLLLAGSALAAVLIAVALRTRRTGDRRGLWLLAALAGLLLAGLAELSRSQINYPYSWHQTRQAISLLGLVLFGLGWLRFVQTRWPGGPPHLDRIVLALAGALALVFALMITGYDGKSAFALAALTAAAGGWLVVRGDGPARMLGLAVLIIPAYAVILPGDVVDRGVHACALAILAVPLIRNPAFLLPEPDRTQPRFALQMTGRALFLDMSEINFVKAAGNYTEVHTRTGGCFLDNRNLGQLLAALPEQDFFRLHRSHGVRLAAADSLRSEEGSRYRLELKTGESLPVGRSQVAALRQRLAGRSA